MHLKSKEIAYGGIMMALTVIFIVLSGFIEQSSLFLLALASFITGIFKRRFQAGASMAFIVGAFLIGFFLAPQKLYCFTFLGFSVYIYVAEYLRDKGISGKLSMAIKGICYHILLSIALVVVNKFIGFGLFFSNEWIKKLSTIPILFILIAIVAAESLWIIFDRAYIFFQDRYGQKLIKMLI